jgi:hypothetical protein
MVGLGRNSLFDHVSDLESHIGLEKLFSDISAFIFDFRFIIWRIICNLIAYLSYKKMRDLVNIGRNLYLFL